MCNPITDLALAIGSPASTTPTRTSKEKSETKGIGLSGSKKVDQGRVQKPNAKANPLSENDLLLHKRLATLEHEKDKRNTKDRAEMAEMDVEGLRDAYFKAVMRYARDVVGN